MQRNREKADCLFKREWKEGKYRRLASCEGMIQKRHRGPGWNGGSHQYQTSSARAGCEFGDGCVRLGFGSLFCKSDRDFELYERKVTVCLLRCMCASFAQITSLSITTVKEPAKLRVVRSKLCFKRFTVLNVD